jgi:hypothetical protein
MHASRQRAMGQYRRNRAPRKIKYAEEVRSN